MKRVCSHGIEAQERGDRCFLVRPQQGDEAEFLAAVAASASLHAPWVAPPNTPQAYAQFLSRQSSQTTLSFFVRQNSDLSLVGVVNISQIVRGLFQSSYLGFYAFLASSGQGLMREGLEPALRHYFNTLGMHRIEANVQPSNSRSLQLVKRLGFRHEGFSPRYLFIDGAWRDHERFAMTSEDFASQSHD